MRTATIRKSLSLLVMTTVAWGVYRGAAFGAPPATKPNILILLADDMGYAEMGCQGCKDVPTPNIDSIARNGIRFSSGYVSCPICAPTRAGLMTGRYQQRFGFETNPGPEAIADPHFGLDGKEVTLAARLKQMGYATGMFGKWHIGYKPELQPTARGFDEFFGFLSGANNYISASRPTGSRNPILRGTQPVTETEYLTDAFGREAVNFIEKHQHEPFFVYLPFNAVHSPLEATEKYLARFPSISDAKRHTFAGMLSALDDNVGRVLETLRRLNLEEKTLVFFLSDNGGPTSQTTSGNAPLHGFKAQVWEGGIRIPFMIQWKGHLPAGKVDDRPVIALDIHPTAVTAAGGAVSLDWKLDGVNLLPYLTGEKTGRPHETLCWRIGEKHAIRHGDWKLVWERELPKPALFNLAQDISESNDLAEKMPDKVQELSEQYQAWNAQMEKPRWEWGGGAPEDQRRTPGAARKAAAKSQSAQGGVEARFKQSDKNGDGKLTPDEFPNAELFKRMDLNGDGVVTLEEAKQAFSGRQAPGATRGRARRQSENP
jgi:arylsulfatase A-like enzyme